MYPRALLIAALSVVSGPSALAAPWYPQECIRVDYCAPVEHVDWVVNKGGRGQLIVSSTRRQAVVARSFAMIESQDGRFHVCMRFDPFGDLEMTCLAVPARPPAP
jgi:hypothetical protein